MHLLIVTPTAAHRLSGNRVTALRWARILRGLGHRVTLRDSYDGQNCHALIALHAHKSSRSVLGFRRDHPQRPIVLILTGTDIYRDVSRYVLAQKAMETADTLVLLQPASINDLSAADREKCRVIYQSLRSPRHQRHPVKRFFKVVVVGHLRSVKDPFRTAIAVRDLPQTSRIRVVHIGAALNAAMRNQVELEMRRNPRYRWIGERPRFAVRRHLLNSHILSVTSKMEGGPAAVMEAVVAGLPVISSRVAGVEGLLRSDYAGYFAVGNTAGLRDLLLRAEADANWYRQLRTAVNKQKSLFRPAREIEAIKRLMLDLNLAPCALSSAG